jgi:prepilin-type N-terminal cleavage/methylation domain-containing protein
MQDTITRLRRRQSVLKDREGGFTLIELLIVIVILGILAAIVVFAVQNLTSQSKLGACQSQYKTVETAQESFKAQTGAYATSFNQLTGQQTGLDGTLDGPWLKDLPPQNVAGNKSPYYLAIDATTVAGGGPSATAGDIMVGTVAANGAKATVTPAGGNVTDDSFANCASA